MSKMTVRTDNPTHHTSVDDTVRLSPVSKQRRSLETQKLINQSPKSQTLTVVGKNKVHDLNTLLHSKGSAREKDKIQLSLEAPH